MLSRDLGGIQQAFVDYSDAIKRHGWSVVNVASRGAQILGTKRVDAAYTVPNFGPLDFISRIYVWYICHLKKPDIIIAHGNRAILFCQWLRGRSTLVGVAHNYNVKYLRKCDYVIAITEHIKHHLTMRGIEVDRILLLPNMIDLENKPKIVESSMRAVPVIGAMGRFVKKKGFDVFLSAISILRARGGHFKVMIGGDGEEKQKLHQLRAKLNLEGIVTFTGWIDNKDKFFADIDIFCLPSEHEPFGIIALEAMQRYKPIVSTRSEGPREIITHGRTGLLCDVGCSEDIACKLYKMLADPSYASKLSHNAYLRLVSHYDINVVSRILIKHLKKVIYDVQRHKV